MGGGTVYRTNVVGRERRTSVRVTLGIEHKRGRIWKSNEK
jgi:hypothetical protein